jgi:hypothetical protein
VIEDQPAPTETPESVAVWPLVIADLDTAIPVLTAEEVPHPAHAAFADHHNAVRDLLRGDMLERDRIGRERYGTPLKTHNGRNHLVDAYQEMLDALVYLRAEIDENTSPPRLISLADMYQAQFGLAFRMRSIIAMAEQRVG